MPGLDLKERIVSFLQGTCESGFRAIDHFGLSCSLEHIEEIMLEYNYEQCPTCSWWVECFERIPDETFGGDGITPDQYCENCRPAKK